MRRSDQLSRPSGRIWCRFSSAKTLLMRRRNAGFPSAINVSGRAQKWPLLGVHRGGDRGRARRARSDLEPAVCTRRTGRPPGRQAQRPCRPEMSRQTAGSLAAVPGSATGRDARQRRFAQGEEGEDQWTILPWPEQSEGQAAARWFGLGFLVCLAVAVLIGRSYRSQFGAVRPVADRSHAGQPLRTPQPSRVGKAGRDREAL